MLKNSFLQSVCIQQNRTLIMLATESDASVSINFLSIILCKENYTASEHSSSKSEKNKNANRSKTFQTLSTNAKI